MAAGLYDITNETLGKGHFAVVKLARHCLTGITLTSIFGELVAVKIIDKARLNNEGLQQLGLEIRLLSRLSEHEHPNIVKLYQVIDTKTKLYLVMEYCGRDVCDLYDYIQKRNSGNGLKESEAKHIFRQICSAIAYCHSLRIVHRDLKPENILICVQSENSLQNAKYPNVKLIDFGFSNQWDEGEKLRTSCGSLAYSAPEILLGDHYDGDKVDIWGLGCILYILLYGNCTFSTPPRPSVSESSISLIKSLLKRDPNSRLTIRQVLQHPWLSGSNREPIPKSDIITDLVKNISSKNQTGKSSLHDNIIDQMLSQKMCHSRDQIESALNKTKSTTDANGSFEDKNNDNVINGDKESYDISHDNYITATYHLLKDKLTRELHISAHNSNANNVTHHHKRILPSRARKQLIQQSSRLRPGFIVEESSDESQDTSNCTSPQLDTPLDEEKFFLPLARKCSIVSEEGSCTGTDYQGSECGSDRLLEIDRHDFGESYPSVDIVVTDCSIEEVKEEVKVIEKAKEDTDVDSSGDMSRTLNSNLTSLHFISSSPELRDEEYEKNENSIHSKKQTSRVIIASGCEQERNRNDLEDAISQKSQKSQQNTGNSMPLSTSVRVIVQSKSCNNILLNDENKSTKMKKSPHESQKNTSDT
ncbi:protein kinase-like protein 6, partial [Dinothrombium tinctorium]